MTEANENDSPPRYEARHDPHGGWLVHDSVYDQPAILNGQALVGLMYLVACARAELMNRPARAGARV